MVWVVILFSVIAVSGSSWGQDVNLNKVSLMPQWLPQAQFAGYMVALDKGFYKEAGLDVTLLRGGPGEPPMEAVRSGRATFCTSWLSTGIQQKAAGEAILNIGQIIQRSGFILVSKKASGILSPADLNGKKVSLWPNFSLQPRAFFRKYGVTVSPIPQGATMSLFLRSGVAAASAMWYNEYHTLLNSGLNEDELVTFFFDRHGLNFPEDGIYCLEKTLRQDPDLCRRFVRASLEGWQYAFSHREETLDVVMRYIREAHVGTNRIHQKWMLARMEDLILPQGSRTAFGALKREDYLRVAGEMRLGGLIREIPPYGEFYVDSIR